MSEAAVEAMTSNGGLALRDELLELGMSERTLRRRLGDGLLLPVNPRVVALAGTRLDLAAVTRAAVLARPDVVPTGLSAAALLGGGPWADVALQGDPWLVGPNDRVLQARFITHPRIRTVRREGMVVAHPSAAVVDLLRFLPREQAAVVGRAALQQRVLSLPDLVAAVERLSRLRGMGQLASVINELADGTHSQAEHELVLVIRESGLLGWKANHPVRIGARRYYIDVAFPAARLAVEADGRAYHSDPRAFHVDRRRQNDLVAAGWTVLRFTWEDIVHRPTETVARIAAALGNSLAS